LFLFGYIDIPLVDVDGKAKFLQFFADGGVAWLIELIKPALPYEVVEALIAASSQFPEIIVGHYVRITVQKVPQVFMVM